MNLCQCSICRRYGAEWIYYRVPEVDIQNKEGTSTKKYIWGDRMLEFHFCDHCGCVTYWYPIDKPEENDMAVNSRMIEPEELKGVEKVIIPVEQDYGESGMVVVS